MEILFKIICCSAVFIGFYHFVLQREKMFRFNRFYLIATLILSFSIPFMELGINEFSTSKLEEFIPQIPQNQEINKSIIAKEIPISEINISTQTIENQSSFFSNLSWIEILEFIGILISLVLLVRFFVNLWKLSRLTFKNEKIKKQGFTLVKIDQNVSPFSFFHYLFASKQDVENEKIQSEIFYHEFAHIKQKHTLDVLFVEFLMIFFWFNPFLYIYRKTIRTNHEFLADEEVLNHHFDTTAYQHLLLEKIPVKPQTSLSSSFNYLVTKKRLIMMTKKTSKIKTAALKFFSIPLLVAVMLVFSEKVSAQVEPRKGVSKELFRQYKKQVRKATVKVKNADGTKTKKVDTSKLDKNLMNEIYAQMSPEQKMKVEPIPSNKKTKIFVSDLENLTFNIDDMHNINLAELSDLGVDLSNLGIEISEDFLKDLDFEKFDILDEETKNEFKNNIKKIEFDGNKLNTYFQSPEFQEKFEKIERVSKTNNKEADSYLKKAQEYQKQAQPFLKKAQEYQKQALPYLEKAKPFQQSALPYLKEAQAHSQKMAEYQKSGNEDLYKKEEKKYDELMKLYSKEMDKYTQQMDLYSGI